MKIEAKQKWMLVVYSVLLIALGVATFILALVDMNAVVTITSIVIAVALFIIGLMHIVTALVAYTEEFFKGELVVGSVAIALGVVLCVYPTMIGAFLPIFLGTLFLALAVVMIVKGIIAIKYKYKGSWIAFYFIVAAVAIALGVLSLIFRNESTQVMYASVGAVLFLAGVVELIFAIKLLAEKKEKSEEPAKE